MCDTLGVVSGGSALFAKNSDRSPNEAQVTEFHPARACKERDLATTYITIPQAKETLAVLLSRPCWIWGAEIGVNEAGVAIGNEAVFTRGAYGKPALTGMDLLRLALERAQNAGNAVNIITELLETYGQGGNCGYDHAFYYDNSFLIADQNSLFVLETCGKKWVAKQYAAASISNRLSIGPDGDRYGGGACDFRRAHTDLLFTAFSGSKKRHAQTSCALENIKSVSDAAAALRTHDESVNNPFTKGSVASCCMHYGGAVGDQTTASMIVGLGGGVPTVYLTGTSLPCVSLFKPYRFGNPARLPVSAPDAAEADGYWRAAETYRRALLGKTLPQSFYDERGALEQSWLADVSSDAQSMDELLIRAAREEKAFYAKYDPEKLPASPVKKPFTGNWKKKNEAFRAHSGAGTLQEGTA
jgi:dipeptidase